MISQISFRRMLYFGIGLSTVVALILAILVIPPSTIPKQAFIPIWVNVIVHLIINVVLFWTINVNKRGRPINTELLAGAGVILILLSLLLIDGAVAYLGQPEQPGVSFWMFVCVGCDFVAGLLILIARFIPKRRSPEK